MLFVFLCVFLSVACMYCVLNLMACFPDTVQYKTAQSLRPKHEKKSYSQNAKCHKAVLSITQHSREANYTLMPSAFLANWANAWVSS